MKPLKFIVIIVLLFTTLSGCVQESKITEEQGDTVAEYMAGLLLKYDDKYDQALIPLSEEDTIAANKPEATVVLSKDGTSQKSKDVKDSVIKSSHALSEVMGNDNFEISYKEYELRDEYPEDAKRLGVSLTSQKGYQFLVVSFTAKNVTKEKQRLVFSKDDINYKLTVDNDRIYSPIITFLDNELQFIDLTIGGGKAEDLVLIFEISKETKVSDIHLEVSDDNKSCIIDIK